MDNKKDTECSQQHPPISEETLCTTSDLQSISYPEAQLILETSHRPHKPQVTTSLLFSFSPPPIEVWLSWQKSALECQTSGKCKSTTESWERERESLLKEEVFYFTGPGPHSTSLCNLRYDLRYPKDNGASSFSPLTMIRLVGEQRHPDYLLHLP